MNAAVFTKSCTDHKSNGVIELSYDKKIKTFEKSIFGHREKLPI
jgi:hypothetical protein